jgi:diguanylate cyclase (GGDEF)-like protein
MERNTINQRKTQAKLLLVLSVVCGLGITPFIFFRAMQEDWAMVALDVAIVIGMVLVFAYVYKTNKTRYPSYLFLFIAQVGSTISFYLNGGHMVNWIYPAMLSTFFVAKPRYALIVNFIILLVYSPKLFTYFETVEIIVIIFSVSISNIITFRFTEGLRIQEKELKKLASEDYLTEVGNRRALKTYLDKLWIKLQKSNALATLIILDLDHFKKINDDYGHLVGDNALVNISRLIKNTLDENHHIFRYGGEEFLIVCPCNSCNSQDGYALAEKIRNEVKNANLIKQSRMTISLGVAQYKQGESVTQWIHRVDEALYQAKNQGRDCVIKV